jgi:prepilin-type N-terminal cleavage/methylation domain-containing protein
MRSNTRHRLRTSLKKGGFTLIEVVVALAIAAGALVLILGANAANLRRSALARSAAELEPKIESKLTEILVKAEKGTRGEIAGLPGWRWESARAIAHVANLKGLRQTNLSVFRPDGSKALEQFVITFEGGGSP